MPDTILGTKLFLNSFNHVWVRDYYSRVIDGEDKTQWLICQLVSALAGD